MAMTAEQFINGYAALEKKLIGAHHCVTCGTPLQETITGCRHTSDGYMCSDCYFEAIGKELDKAPIFMPRTVHGA
ncbi:MAG: hypothetical protein PHI29_12740 [Gallionella sp.]|nr:hypothetical protein [Gallionella sp.]